MSRRGDLYERIELGADPPVDTRALDMCGRMCADMCVDMCVGMSG